MKKLMKKRTGFTLVELLIVIIIIGILAGAMLLVAGSGTDKAEATKIVSNLRSLKAATLLYYADKYGAGPNVPLPTIVDNTSSDLDQYMDRKLHEMGTDYTVISNDAGNWFVGKTSLPSTGVAGKLADVAATSGIYADKDETAFTAASTAAYMKAR